MFFKPVEFLNTLFSSCRKFMRVALNTDLSSKLGDVACGSWSNSEAGITTRILACWTSIASIAGDPASTPLRLRLVLIGLEGNVSWRVLEVGACEELLPKEPLDTN